MPKEPLLIEKSQLKKYAGFSLVEVILASSLFALLVVALIGAWLFGQEATSLSGNRARANLLAEEGLEAVRNLRDSDFANLVDGTYGLGISSNQWALAGTSDVTDIFTRQITIASIDTKRKNITSQVTWQQNPQRTGTVTLTTRLSKWLASGIGDWSNPLLQSTADIAGNQDNGKVQVIGNYAYVTRGNGNPNFAIFNISNPASPSVVGSLALAGTPTNLFVLGNYAYITNTDGSRELQIINISNPSSPTLTSTFDIPGSVKALDVFVSGTTAFVVRGNSGNDEFVTINVANPASPTFIGSLDLGADANEVVVSGNYAYVASSSDTQELQVISIANLAAPSLVGSLNLPGTANATTIAIAGSIIVIGQNTIFYTINVAIPAVPVQLGSLTISGTIKDIALNFGNNNSYAYIATNNNNLEFQVIDLTTPALPKVLGSVNTSGNDNFSGIAYDPNADRAFAVGNASTQEFFILQPQ